MGWTIFGASGFVGSHLVQRLHSLGETCRTPQRDEALSGQDLGTVVYCIGMTADFRQRPFDTVEAHISRLQEILRTCTFRSLIYLSSARIYKGLSGPVSECMPLSVYPTAPDDLYNLSKLMGESLALSCGQPTKIVRLSNVYGRDLHSVNFLTAVLQAALKEGTVTLQTSRESAKDYISIDDVVDLLLAIAQRGRERVYNVASGHNISHGEILDYLQQLTGCEVQVAPKAPVIQFPPIDISRIVMEFGFRPRHLLADLPHLVAMYREKGTSA